MQDGWRLAEACLKGEVALAKGVVTGINRPATL